MKVSGFITSLGSVRVQEVRHGLFKTTYRQDLRQIKWKLELTVYSTYEIIIIRFDVNFE